MGMQPTIPCRSGVTCHLERVIEGDQKPMTLNLNPESAGRQLRGRVSPERSLLPRLSSDLPSYSGVVLELSQVVLSAGVEMCIRCTEMYIIMYHMIHVP